MILSPLLFDVMCEHLTPSPWGEMSGTRGFVSSSSCKPHEKLPQPKQINTAWFVPGKQAALERVMSEEYKKATGASDEDDVSTSMETDSEDEGPPRKRAARKVVCLVAIGT